MATEVATNPEIPYVGTVENGLEPGKMVRIRGKVPENAVRFAVNYQLGPILNPRDDIALHISPRFSEGVITRNHIESMTWGANEDEGPLCIRPGQEFEIIILCDHANYKIAINGRHFAEFAHRLPYEKVTHLVIDGDVEVSSIIYERVPIGSARSSPPMPSVPTAEFGPPPPGGLYPSLDTKSTPGYGPPPPGYGPPPSPYGPSTENNQSGEKENSFGGLFGNIPWSGLAAAGSMVAMEYANRKKEEEQIGKTDAPNTKSESGSALSSTLTAIATNIAASAIQRNLHAQQGYPSQGPGGDVLGSILGALGGAGAQRPAYQPPPPPPSNTDPLSGGESCACKDLVKCFIQRKTEKMWSSLWETAKLSPFSTPFTTVKCQGQDESMQTLVKNRTISAASANGDSCEFGSNKYFALCGLGGILSCGITHTMVTPLDLVKCRIQVDPAKYKSVFNGFRVTVAEDGTRGLVRGWAPTFFGYSIQGMFKFGLYEVFKVYYSALAGEEMSYEYRTSLYLVSSASAEFFADIGLAPLEAAKVRIQTMPGYANTLREAFPKMYADEGLGGFYKGLVPLWLRQIPYTMMKFACFERTLELLYKYVVPKPRLECTKGEQLVVTFAAGYIAGVFCAVVSHPADSVVSKLNQEKGATAGDVLRKLGFAGVWKGLGPRIIMIGTLTAAQWFIYDAVKVWLRMPRPPPPEMPESLKKKYGLA